MNPFALTLLTALTALGAVIAIDLIRNNTNPLHDPSDDDADFDPRIADLASLTQDERN